jgi:N-acyl homoserine lactone hydrolase
MNCAKFAICFASSTALAVMMQPAAAAQKAAEPVKSVRLYMFDCGMIKGFDATFFSLKKEEIAGTTDMVVPCYLVAHPKGTLMWDVGVIPDSVFKGGNGPVSQPLLMATSSVDKPLVPQLAALGYNPRDITYVAFSHYHRDHVANANAFAGSTWLVHPTERQAMFAQKPEGQTAYSALSESKTVSLPDSDYDVFGDGTVVIKYAPGHTPGHQVLFLKLPKTGPVLLGGDLWHYPEERGTDKVPPIESSKEQTLASRKAIEAFLKASGAQLWIQHNVATFRRLKTAPQYFD